MDAKVFSLPTSRVHLSNYKAHFLCSVFISALETEKVYRRAEVLDVHGHSGDKFGEKMLQYLIT
jgi:hypothetical protein